MKTAPPLVSHTLGNVADIHLPDVEIDYVWLTSDERSSPHMLVHSDKGRSIRVSFARGAQQELRDGDILIWNDTVAVIVKAAPEDLLVVKPPSRLSWGVAGYQLGNLHRPVRFTETAMLTPYDPMVVDILDKLKVDYQREETPFVGWRLGAYTGHSH